MSVWAQMLTKQPRSTLHALDHVHEGPDMLLYLYSKYIHAVIFLPLIFLSWTSVILSVLNACESANSVYQAFLRFSRTPGRGYKLTSISSIYSCILKWQVASLN